MTIYAHVPTFQAEKNPVVAFQVEKDALFKWQAVYFELNRIEITVTYGGYTTPFSVYAYVKKKKRNKERRERYRNFSEKKTYIPSPPVFLHPNANATAPELPRWENQYTFLRIQGTSRGTFPLPDAKDRRKHRGSFIFVVQLQYASE